MSIWGFSQRCGLKACLSSSERLRFQQAYYHFWLLASPSSVPLCVEKRLNEKGLRACEGVFLTSQWLSKGCPSADRSRLSFTLRMSTIDGSILGRWYLDDFVIEFCSQIFALRYVVYCRLSGRDYFHHLGALIPCGSPETMYDTFFDHQ